MSNRTALQMAIENDNIEIVKLLLSHQKIDVNAKYIINKIIQLHSKSSNLIPFKVQNLNKI